MRSKNFKKTQGKLWEIVKPLGLPSLIIPSKFLSGIFKGIASYKTKTHRPPHVQELVKFVSLNFPHISNISNSLRGSHVSIIFGWG